MPKPTRLSFLAIAVMLAACAGPGTPQGSPASTGEASGSPGPVPTTTATRAVSTAPTAAPTLLPMPSDYANCDEVEDIDPPSPYVDASTTVGHAGIDLQITRIEERWGDHDAVTPPARELRNEGVGLLVGGHEFLTRPSTYYEGHANPSTMVKAVVTLTLDGALPIELAVRFVPGNENFDQVAVMVPDVSGPGTLAFDFTWTDRCFQLQASGSTAVEVVPTTVTNGCALDEEGYFEHLEDVLKPGLEVGSVTTTFFVPEHRAKYIAFENPAIDAFILYLFDREQPTVTVDSGALVRVENRSSAMELSGMRYWIWTRSSVAAAVTDYPPMGSVEVSYRTPEQQADGTWRLRVPTEAGRYVAGVEFSYETKCGTGTAWAMVKITVAAP